MQIGIIATYRSYWWRTKVGVSSLARTTFGRGKAVSVTLGPHPPSRTPNLLARLEHCSPLGRGLILILAWAVDEQRELAAEDWCNSVQTHSRDIDNSRDSVGVTGRCLLVSKTRQRSY